MELKIKKAHAELKNVNLRTENNGDDRVLACDLKLQLDATAKELAPLFADVPNLLDAIYDQGGDVLCPEFQLVYRVPIENVEVTLDKLKPMKGGKIKKNAILLPRNGKRMQVTLTVQFSGVGDIRPMAARLHGDISVTIIEQQETLSLVSKEDAQAEAA